MGVIRVADFHFEELKNLKIPEAWKEKALKIPEQNYTEPKSMSMKYRLITSAAAAVLVIVVSITLFLNLSQPSNVIRKKDNANDNTQPVTDAYGNTIYPYYPTELQTDAQGNTIIPPQGGNEQPYTYYQDGVIYYVYPTHTTNPSSNDTTPSSISSTSASSTRETSPQSSHVTPTEEVETSHNPFEPDTTHSPAVPDSTVPSNTSPSFSFAETTTEGFIPTEEPWFPDDPPEATEPCENPTHDTPGGNSPASVPYFRGYVQTSFYPNQVTGVVYCKFINTKSGKIYGRNNAFISSNGSVRYATYRPTDYNVEIPYGDYKVVFYDQTGFEICVSNTFKINNEKDTGYYFTNVYGGKKT